MERISWVLAKSTQDLYGLFNDSLSINKSNIVYNSVKTLTQSK